MSDYTKKGTENKGIFAIFCHPELVSGSSSFFIFSVSEDWKILKQVQYDWFFSETLFHFDEFTILKFTNRKTHTLHKSLKEIIILLFSFERESHA